MIESSAEKSLGDQKDASKQGRNDQDEGISFVHDAEIQGRYGHDTKINTASTSITTDSINITTAEPVTTRRQKKDQIEFDKEVAQRIHAQLEEEERMARQQEEEEKIVEWDDVQAMMDANHVLAERLQAEEQGELSIKERSKLFVELMNQRKKHFARLIAEEKRRKPLTKAQKRNQMIESSAEKSLGDQKDASKQGRNDQDEGISFFHDAEIQGRYGHDTKINTASTSITTDSINITTAEPVTTVSALITTVGVSTLMKMRSEKAKEKAKEIGSKEKSSETATRPARGVIMREASETTTRPTVPPQQLLDPKDKEEERMARQQEEEEKIVEWDDVQAMMDANHALAERLQVEEQGELSIKERSKLFVELAEEKRRKPLTKAQKRNQMCAYLKNMNIDREDLETLWKLVKAKYGNTRPEEAYEVMW
nr:hypothetical protein [Tanacetum cinerariifolium]